MTKDANGKNTVKVITVKAQPQTHALRSIDMSSVVAAATKAPPVTPATMTVNRATASAARVVTSTSPKVAKTPPITPKPVIIQLPKDGNTSNNLSLRNTPKVKYTGRRGRPPIIKPGESDPHAKERETIENNLKANNFARIIVQGGDKGHQTGETFTAFEHVSIKLQNHSRGEKH